MFKNLSVNITLLGSKWGWWKAFLSWLRNRICAEMLPNPSKPHFDPGRVICKGKGFYVPSNEWLFLCVSFLWDLFIFSLKDHLLLCEELFSRFFVNFFCGGGRWIICIIWNQPDQPHSSFSLTIWDHLGSSVNHLESSVIPDETSLPPMLPPS